jgi:hypothetical protein
MKKFDYVLLFSCLFLHFRRTYKKKSRRDLDVGDTSHDTENIMLYYTLHYTLLLLPHTSHDISHETRSSQRHKRS